MTEKQKITHVYEVEIGNQTHELDNMQLERLYSKIKSIMDRRLKQTKIDDIIQKSEKLGYVEYEDSLIPVGYKQFAVIKSQPRNGKPIHHYHYFKDNKNNYGFIIKNGITTAFARLGNINDSESHIGKTIRAIPTNKNIMKSFIPNNRLVTNNQKGKAVFDILILEGFLQKVSDADAHVESYRVTNKVKELEFDDNIEPLKVQVAPTHNR